MIIISARDAEKFYNYSGSYAVFSWNFGALPFLIFDSLLLMTYFKKYDTSELENSSIYSLKVYFESGKFRLFIHN